MKRDGVNAVVACAVLAKRIATKTNTRNLDVNLGAEVETIPASTAVCNAMKRKYFKKG